jgi:hypothetical protein
MIGDVIPCDAPPRTILESAIIMRGENGISAYIDGKFTFEHHPFAPAGYGNVCTHQSDKKTKLGVQFIN